MSYAVQDFAELLKGILTAQMPPEYRVQFREPMEGELKADVSDRQIFITVNGIEAADPEYADGGFNTAVRVAVMVGTVMKRPQVLKADGSVDIAKSELLYKGTLKRCATVVQAIQDARRQFANSHSHVLTEYIGEAPQMIEGFYVSVAGVTLTFNLDSEEQL